MTKPKNKENPLTSELVELENELKSTNPNIFKGIPEEKRAELLKSFSVISVHQKLHSGPLPDPETLSEYNQIITNGADRIMTMAEKQQDHRIKIESKAIGRQSFQSLLGQIFGLVIGLTGIGSGTYLAAIGETTVGGIIAGGTVVSLVSIFVLGKKAQRKTNN